MHSSLILKERIKRMFNRQKDKKFEEMLIKENKELKEKNVQLRSKIERMEKYINEYTDLVDEVKEIRDRYKKELDKIEEIKNEYKKELDKIIS